MFASTVFAFEVVCAFRALFVDTMFCWFCEEYELRVDVNDWFWELNVAIVEPLNVLKSVMMEEL
jgi:hypothetical protein